MHTKWDGDFAVLLQSLLAPEYFLFTLSIGLFFGLLILELLFLMIGGSLMGGDNDADISAPDGIEADFDADLDFDIDTDLADLDLDTLDTDLTETEALDAAGDVGVLAWLGMGNMPLAIWLASMLLSFGVVGVGVQLALSGTIGLTLNSALAAVPAFFGARWLPKPSVRSLRALFRKWKPNPFPNAIWDAARALSAKAPPRGDALPRCVSATGTATSNTCAPNPFAMIR